MADRYPSHESSDEGTCWCPVAEQAGRERDALRAERDRLREGMHNTSEEHLAALRENETLREALGGLVGALHTGDFECRWAMRDAYDVARAALNAKGWL